MNVEVPNADRLGDDVLNGVPEIAKFVGETEVQVRWHVRKGHYDGVIFKLPGSKIVRAHKSGLRKLYSPKR
jgi:hypothetical protein